MMLVAATASRQSCLPYCISKKIPFTIKKNLAHKMRREETLKVAYLPTTMTLA
jgi:hypothetical protein